MPPRHAPRRQSQVARHARRGGSRSRVLRAVALGTSVVLALGTGAAASVYARLQGNIDSTDISALVSPVPADGDDATSAPPEDLNAGQALNILVMGSDGRDGENEAIGGRDEGMRSDTTILVHISADRSRVQLVSIPRDSVVDIPACRMSDGSTSSPRTDLFNSAFATGADLGGDVASAAACTISTVQATTGIEVPHFVVVDFAGFVRMVDALGGVRTCIPHYMRSTDAKLELHPGEQTLDGAAALSLARGRTGIGLGDGSDLGRLDRQQDLLAATLEQLLATSFFTDPGALLGFFDAATDSLTTDQQLGSLSALTGLAFSLRGIEREDVTFLTIPVATAPTDRNHVVWTPEAEAIWAAIAADEPLPGEPERPRGDGAGEADPGTPSSSPVDPEGAAEPGDAEGGSSGADDDAVCAPAAHGG